MKTIRACLVATTMLMLTASALQAQGAAVTCKDGSKSAGGRGACSSHGGIAPMTKAAVKADAKMAKADKKADMKMDKMEKKADMKMDKADAKMDKAAMKGDDHDARGATAECKDHTYSHAATHQGACSRHGGVAKFLDAR
jgi:hypothetical protein